MSGALQELNRSYVLHGSGGITTVQTLLAGHGQCHFSFWDPCPPAWRVRFVTCLTPEDLRQLLAQVMQRYGIQLFQEVAAYPGKL